MNLDTDYESTFADHAPAAYKLRRRMRVRHRYPDSLVELVGHLRTRMPAREIAAAFDIPLSSVYRWAPIARASSAIDKSKNSVEDWKPLISRCESEGFAVPLAITKQLMAVQPAGHNERSKQRDDARTDGLPARLNLQAARSMIERNYFRDIDSHALAAAAGLSRFRFIHAFTETFNISPHQYLLRTRLDAAKRLLATSGETIDVIAAATGFRSGACLNRAFTRTEGYCISRFCRVVDPRT